MYTCFSVCARDTSNEVSPTRCQAEAQRNVGTGKIYQGPSRTLHRHSNNGAYSSKWLKIQEIYLIVLNKKVPVKN